MANPILVFWVQGTPIPKARPRVVNGRAHTPQRTKDWEERIAWEALLAMQGCQQEILIGDLSIALSFLYGNHKADLDNLIKAVLDALNGVVWHDDVQVTSLSAKICRGIAKDKQGINITISQDVDPVDYSPEERQFLLWEG